MMRSDSIRMPAQPVRGAELAIFGTPPAFDEILHVGRPNLGDGERFRARMESIWERKWLTNNGPMVQEFERRITEQVGVNHCVCMCNATVAMEIATRALGMCGEVIVPSFTFVATAHALQWQEIRPVFCDVDPATHNIDPNCIESLITPRTSGIVGVHVWGRPCATKQLEQIAARRGLRLVFDAAHAFGCSHEGRMVGGFGAAEVFSFHATKFLNAFEGGAVVTNDGELAEKMRLMRNFGFKGQDQVIHVGTNGKMSEVSAAMGLTSLESMDEFVQTNRRNHTQYCQELEGTPGITVVGYNEKERCNYQYVVVDVDDKECGLTRDELLQVLHAENVRARRYFWPGVHRMEPYKSLYPQSHLWLPNTEQLAARMLQLPTGTAVSAASITLLCGVIRTAVRESEAVSAALNRTRQLSPAAVGVACHPDSEPEELRVFEAKKDKETDGGEEGRKATRPGADRLKAA